MLAKAQVTLELDAHVCRGFKEYIHESCGGAGAASAFYRRFSEYWRYADLDGARVEDTRSKMTPGAVAAAGHLR